MQAVVFDMDGVIVDSEIHWFTVDGNFLSELIPHWSDDLQKIIIGLSLYDVYSYLVKDHGLKVSEDEYLGFYRPLAQEIYGEKCELIDGVVELVSAIYEAKIPLAVCSSSPREWIDLVLERFGFDQFSVISSGDQVRGRGKPNPDIYQITCERLGLTPANVVAIEDSRRGVMSAKSAGLKCVGLCHASELGQDLSAADVVVETHRALSVEKLKGLFIE